MVNFCFIQPPSSLLLEDKVMPPLGILYLSAWLRKHGHGVSIVDLAGVDDWRKYLIMSGESKKIYKSDIVGFTATTPQYRISGEIRDWIKKTFYVPDRPKFIIGGIHITSLVYANEYEFLNDGFDSYCIGEGYNAVTKMAEDFPNLKRMYSEPILKDVNELPFAARDLIDIKSYKYKLGDIPTTTFYTQYGCYYECSYCESKMAGSFTVRAMTPQRIQDEIRHVRDTYGIKGVMFFDDELNLDKKRILAICDKIKELGDIVWRGFMVTAKFDREIAEACKESNCYEVASGIESGSPTILRNIRKPATLDMNKKFLITGKKAGLRTKAFMIIGLPGESWQTIRESYDFLKSLGEYRPDDVDFSILQVYKGSNIYKTPMDVEFEDYDSDKMYYKSSPDSYTDLIQVRTKEMSKYDLVAARNLMESEFKKKDWIKEYSDRKDLDEVYKRDSIEESIRYAKKKLQIQD
jgi:anaerobic magnesium-protoporphyrin IX monomethyl ester cyclase